MGPEALGEGHAWAQCRGSEATSPAWGSAQVNEPPRGPRGSKSSPSKGRRRRGCSQGPPGRGWGEAARGDPLLVGWGQAARGRLLLLPPTSLPGGEPSPDPSPRTGPTWRLEAALVGPEVARAAQWLTRCPSPPSLTPRQFWLQDLCSQESASQELGSFTGLYSHCPAHLFKEPD